MMDRIVVTAADIEKLLAWRDEHNDLVRSMPVPLREVKIQIVESGISIKCFRFDKKLKLYLDSPSRKLGHVVFAPLGNGLWKKKVSTLSADCNPAETEQGALTVYGSLMALMAYGASETPAATEVENEPKAHTGHKRSTRWNPASTTYILHSSGKQLSVAPKATTQAQAAPSLFAVISGITGAGRPSGLPNTEKGPARSRARPTRLEVIWMNEKSEWQFLIDYVKDDTTDFGLDSCRNQLLALWTVYCMHNDLDVDTAMYDAVLLDLFNALSLEQRRELCRNYYPKFDDVMGVWLA
mgnify:FL=1